MDADNRGMPGSSGRVAHVPKFSSAPMNNNLQINSSLTAFPAARSRPPVDFLYTNVVRPTLPATQSSHPQSTTQLIAPLSHRSGRGPRPGGGRQMPFNKVVTTPKPPPSRETLLRAGREIIHTRDQKFREAHGTVTNGMNVRVQRVIDMLCRPMSDAELSEVIFKRCLKCSKHLLHEGQKAPAATDGLKLRELFCRSCTLQLCDLCWKFADLEKRSENDYEVEFKSHYQCGKCCAKCLRRCWICTRHVKPPSNMNVRANLTVDDRLFNRCRAIETANAVSRLSKKAYCEATKQVYDERKDTLRLFQELAKCWSDDISVATALKDKLATDFRSPATWRYVRGGTNKLSVWFEKFKSLDAELLPVVNDGRAMLIYQHLQRRNLLPPTVGNNSEASYSFPRVPSGEEARAMFAGKRIVVMGDSIGRHVYRDLINLLQGDGPLAMYTDFSFKGDEQYCNDICVYGTHYDVRRCNIKSMDWYEHRIFYGPRQITVEYVWITRVWNDMVQNDLKTLFDSAVYRRKYNLRRAPDVVIFNSTLWDLSRYRDYDYSSFEARCNTFAKFWGEIAPTAANIPAPIFINYSTPKPGQTITGDLVADLTNEDYEAARTDTNVKNTLRYLYKAMQNKLVNQPAVLGRVGFVDLYEACQTFRLEEFRFADGIHYDPPAVRVFSSLIIAEYLKLSQNSWPAVSSSAPHQSNSKRGADGGQATASAAADSVRTQWLYKCHDSLSAHTMSLYNAISHPAEFALREFRNHVHENRFNWIRTRAPANVKKLEFFVTTNRVRQYMPYFPIREMPSIVARLYALMHAMLDDMGRLHLIRHACIKGQTDKDGMQTIFPMYDAPQSRVVAKEIIPYCRKDLLGAVSAVLSNMHEKPDLVHYGSPNGPYANENFVRWSFLFGLLAKAEYMTPLYRFVRDISDPRVQEVNREGFKKEMNGARDDSGSLFDKYALRLHIEQKDAVEIGAYIKTKTSLAEFLSSSSDYVMGSDLAGLLYNNAMQPTVVPSVQPSLPPPQQPLAITRPHRPPPREEELQQLLPRLAIVRKPKPVVTPAATTYLKTSKPAPVRAPPAVLPAMSSSASTSAVAAAEKVVPRGFVAPKIKKKQMIRAVEKNPDTAERARPQFGRAVHVNEEGFVVERVEDDEEESEDDAASLDDDQYEIAAITNLQKHKYTTSENRIEYKIRWAKYPKLEDWWEPIQSLTGCKDMLDEFMAHPQVQEKYQKILGQLAKDDEEEAAAKTTQEEREEDTANAAAVAEPVEEERDKATDDEANDADEPKKKSKSVKFAFDLLVGRKSSKNKKLIDKPHKSIMKKAHADNNEQSSKRSSKKIIDSDDDDNAMVDAIRRDRERRKKERKEKKQMKKTERHLAKLEKAEKKREKAEKAEKAKKAVNTVAGSSAAAETEKVVSADNVDVGNGSKAKKSTKRKPRVYSEFWRKNSLARGVRKQLQLRDIICFIPRADLLEARKVEESLRNPPVDAGASSSSSVRSKANGNDSGAQNDAEHESGNAAAVDDERPVAELALVKWKKSREIEAVELELLKEYYPHKLLDAFMEYAKPLERQ